MFRSSRHPQFSPQRRESGIATVLIVVLVSIAVTAVAVVMIAMLSARSTHEKQVAVIPRPLSQAWGKFVRKIVQPTEMATPEFCGFDIYKIR